MAGANRRGNAAVSRRARPLPGWFAPPGSLGEVTPVFAFPRRAVAGSFGARLLLGEQETLVASWLLRGDIYLHLRLGGPRLCQGNILRR